MLSAQRVLVWSGFVFLTLFGIACGNAESNLNEDNGSNIHILIYADNPTGHILLVSLPGKSTALSCSADAQGQCQNAINTTRLADVQTSGNSYSVFQSDSLPSLSGYYNVKDSQAGTSRLVQIGDANGSQNTTGINWKALLLGGDYFDPHQNKNVKVWDNARVELKKQLEAKGVNSANFQELSADPEVAKGAIRRTSKAELQSAMGAMNVGAGEGCFVFMTSHGTEQGFYIKAPNGDEILSPGEFSQMLDSTCGEKPTIALVSACYSGVMLEDASIKKPNRFIMTAASKDVTSFGCDASLDYTFWDRCLLDSFPGSKTYEDLSTNIKACVTKAEQQEKTDHASDPQTFIGDNLKGKDVLGAP